METSVSHQLTLEPLLLTPANLVSFWLVSKLVHVSLMESGLKLVPFAGVNCVVEKQILIIYFFYLAIDCGPLDFPVNGIVRVDSTTVGSIAFYSCHPAFQLVGQERRTCQENGEWSGTKPECQCIFL